MAISNVVEPMNLAPIGKERHCDGMDRCVSPTLVIKTASAIEVVKKLGIPLRTEKVEIT